MFIFMIHIPTFPFPLLLSTVLIWLFVIVATFRRKNLKKKILEKLSLMSIRCSQGSVKSFSAVHRDGNLRVYPKAAPPPHQGCVTS